MEIICLMNDICSRLEALTWEILIAIELNELARELAVMKIFATVKETLF